MYPWEIVGMYVGLCMCLYTEKEGRDQKTKRMTPISSRENALASCVIDTGGRTLRGKKLDPSLPCCTKELHPSHCPDQGCMDV